jgi:MFS family permease
MKSETALLPDQVNEHGQVVDEKILKKNRVVFTLGNMGFNGVNFGLGAGIPTKLVKLMGGGDQHLGLMGSLYGLTTMLQFMGALFLRKTGSDKRAMRFASAGMAVLYLMVMGSALSSLLHLGSAAFSLYLYLAFCILCAPMSAAGNNIEATWVGDLVPRDRLGWFNSVKFIGTTILQLGFTLFFGKYADHFPTLAGYSSAYFFLALFYFLSFIAYGFGTNREPKNLRFFSSGASHHERLNYSSFALWCYIAFYALWAGGRAVLNAFTVIFLLEEFHFSMTNLAWLMSTQFIVSVIVIWILGRLSDKKGNRLILIAVSGFVALCMYLWVSSAWLGIVPIIIYYIVNGAAGQTHGMLGGNLGLEIFPDKGRAEYIAFGRFFTGIMMFAGPIIAGIVIHIYSDAQVVVFGKTLTKYYLTFATGATITLACVIPLIIMGKRKVV